MIFFWPSPALFERSNAKSIFMRLRGVSRVASGGLQPSRASSPPCHFPAALSPRGVPVLA